MLQESTCHRPPFHAFRTTDTVTAGSGCLIPGLKRSVNSLWIPSTRGLESYFCQKRPNLISRSARMSEAVMRGCKEKFGDIPRFMTTAFVARDVDAIREALGEETLTGFMVSYGTGIGASAMLDPFFWLTSVD